MVLAGRNSMKLGKLSSIALGVFLAVALIHLAIGVLANWTNRTHVVFDFSVGFVGTLMLITIVNYQSGINNGNQEITYKRLIVRAFVHSLIILIGVNLARYYSSF